MKAFISKRTIAIVICLSAVAFHSSSQTSQAWARQYGSDKEDYARNHVIDSQGNIYISGYTFGNIAASNEGGKDGYLMKLDSLGNTVWSKQFGSAGDEDIQWSAIDKYSCVYIVGTTTGNLEGKNHGREDFFVVKYNASGQKLWTKQFGTDSIDMAYGIFADNKGYIYICGATLGTLGKSGSGKQDAFIMKLNKNGDVQFINQFGTPLNDAAAAITGDNRGNIYITGPTFGTLAGAGKGFMDVYTGQFTDNGKLVKFMQFGSGGFDVPTCIQLDNENNIYVGGTTSGDFGGPQMGEGDCFFMKINSKGEQFWNRQFGTEKNDGVKAIVFNGKVSDQIIISGLQNLPPAHAYIRMYLKDGSLQWEKNIVPDGSGFDASGKDVTLDNQGNIVHLGLTASDLFAPSIGGPDFYIVKMRLENTYWRH